MYFRTNVVGTLSRIPARSMPDALFNLGRSRVRENRTLGSVRAKAEWLSYPTHPLPLTLTSSPV